MKEDNNCIDFFHQSVFDEGERQSLTITFSILCFFIVPSNILVVYGLYKTKIDKKRLTVSRKLILALMFVQALIGLILVPFQIYMVQGGADCSLNAAHAFLRSFFFILCANIMVIVCTERHVLITHRKKHRKDYSVSQTRFYFGVSLVVSTTWGVAYALLVNQTDYGKLATYYVALAVYAGLLLLFVLMTGLKILNRVKLSSKTSSLSLHNKRSERKLSITIFIMATLMVVCYAPMVVSMIIAASWLYGKEDPKESFKTQVMCNIPVYINFTLLPIIYFMFDHKIRSLYNTRLVSDLNSNSALSFPKPPRKMSKANSFSDMKNNVSAESATCEIKGGVLVVKQVERKNRKLSRQVNVNVAFEEE